MSSSKNYNVQDQSPSLMWQFLSRNNFIIMWLCFFKSKFSNQEFQNYRSTSYGVYSPETYKGHWKQLTVRTSRNGHIMAIAYFNPQVLNMIYVIRGNKCMLVKQAFQKLLMVKVFPDSGNVFCETYSDTMF